MDKTQLDKVLQVSDSKFKRKSVEHSVAGKALLVHLDTETSENFDIPVEWLDTYISGPALGFRIWSHFATEKADFAQSYEAFNPVILVPFSHCGLCSVVFRSNTTNMLAVNTIESNLGKRIKESGYSAVVLLSRCRRLSCIDIAKGRVSFSVSEQFVGLSVSGMQSFLHSDDSSSIVIGTAGESHVSYATAVCDGEPTGRLGLGYVLGMKNIKAISVHLSLDGKPADFGNEALSTKYLHTANGAGWAPIDNFRRRMDPRLFHLSLPECERKATSIRYEAALMLGSNVCCFDPLKVRERYEMCLELGLDPVSTGNILGWMKQNGEQSDNRIDFTDNSVVLPLIESLMKIAPNGLIPLAAECGGSDYAYTVNGLECGPFDYRGCSAMALNDAENNWFPVFVALDSDLHSRKPAKWIFINEVMTMGLESNGFDPRKVFEGKKNIIYKYFPVLFLRKLKKYGKSLDIFASGRRCKMLFDEINCILGKKYKDIPDYFKTDPTSNCENGSVVDFHKLTEKYCTVRDFSDAILQRFKYL